MDSTDRDLKRHLLHQYEECIYALNLMPKYTYLQYTISYGVLNSGSLLINHHHP
jgi:hypothetical protein